MIRETAELYRTVTQPYIEALDARAIQWVYNILDNDAEPERRLIADPDPETGFVMQYDTKWDQSKLEQLHCLAIVRSSLQSVGGDFCAIPAQ